jgi:hypothetical protein
VKIKYVSLFVILLVLTSAISLFSGTRTIDYVSARYAPENTQTQANENECTTGTNCGITSPQSQGDGTANSPTNLQISKLNEEQDGIGGEPSVVNPAFLSVFVQVTCLNVDTCPPQTPSPNDFEFRMANIPFPAVAVSPVFFRGSQTGTEIHFDFQRPEIATSSTFRVDVEFAPPTPPGLSGPEITSGCQGTINSGEFFRTCAILIRYLAE